MKIIKRVIKLYLKKYKRLSKKDKKRKGWLLILLGVLNIINPFVSGGIIIIAGVKMIYDSKKSDCKNLQILEKFK